MEHVSLLSLPYSHFSSLSLVSEDSEHCCFSFSAAFFFPWDFSPLPVLPEELFAGVEDFGALLLFPFGGSAIFFNSSFRMLIFASRLLFFKIRLSFSSLFSSIFFSCRKISFSRSSQRSSLLSRSFPNERISTFNIVLAHFNFCS